MWGAGPARRPASRRVCWSSRKGSTWTSLDGATDFGTRPDGGPTSYAANIRLPGDRELDSYREFPLEWQETQLAYGPATKGRPDCYAPPDPAVDGGRPVNTAAYTRWHSTHSTPVG